MSHTVTEYGLRNFYESIKSLMKTNTKNKNLIQLQITASKRKRILFHLMGGFISGGSDRCLFSLLTQLDQSKYEPFLLYKKKSILVKQLQDMGIKLIPFPNHSKENAKSQLKKTVNNKRTKKKPNIIKILLGKSYFLYSLLSNSKILINAVPEILRLAKIVIVNRIDMIHANHNLNGDRAIILTAILLRKKIISHNRGLYNPLFIDRYISRYIDQIICVSNFSKGVYEKHGVPIEKCITIYDGVDTKKFKSSFNESTTIIIGCIGRLEKWKGQQVLVKAAEIIVKKIPEIKFLLVGDGDNEDELKIQIKNKGLEKYFEFTGAVINIIDYMEKCAIIVHTSIEPEPFGMVIIEAMALEKPVIATNFGGPKEIIDNEKDGFLIPPQNPTILAEYILKLIQNPGLRTQIGIKAREKVITKFDLGNTIKQIELVYEEVSK